MKEQNAVSAAHIARLRNNINLKQEELAQVVSEMIQRDVPYRANIVSAWETGNRTPTIEAAQAMAELFNVSVDYILGKTNVPNESAEASSENPLSATKLDFESLSNYHNMPVYVVFPHKEHMDCWALVDCRSPKKIVLRTINEDIDVTRDNYPYYIFPRALDELENNALSRMNKLGLVQVIDSRKPVYLKVTSCDIEVNNAYNGWYSITKDKMFLQGENGKLFPITGLGITYNCYTSNR